MGLELLKAKTNEEYKYAFERCIGNIYSNKTSPYFVKIMGYNSEEDKIVCKSLNIVNDTFSITVEHFFKHYYTLVYTEEDVKIYLQKLIERLNRHIENIPKWK